MKITFKLLLIFSLFTSCIPMQKVPKGAKMTDFFHFQKADNYDASKWAIFLPGTGGLRIFKDTTHYFNVAKKLNAEGISVLLVDNVAAYKASKRNVDEEEPSQILWTLEQALKWARESERIYPNSKGSIVGWSRAGLVDDILEHMIAENVNIKVYDEAYHGYDVESLTKGKYYRIIPFISKKHYLLKYNQEAASESFEELIEFLKKQ